MISATSKPGVEEFSMSRYLKAMMIATLVATSAFALNYNSSKSNTGNIVIAYPSTVSDAQAAGALAELEKTHQTPTEAAVRPILTAKGVKQGGMKIIIEQKDGKTNILLLADQNDEQKARAAINLNSSRSNTQHN
jgi:hypothetical protein